MIQYPMNGLDGDYVCPLVSSPFASSVPVPGSATFTDQLSVVGSALPVTYVETSGAPALTVSSTGLVATGGALTAGTYVTSGTTSDANGDVGTFLFTLSVGAITQTLPTLASVKSPGSGTFSDQLVVTGNDGTVNYVEITGTPALNVSTSGLITASTTLAAGTYNVTGTTSDVFGDAGTFAFTLNVGIISQTAPTSSSVVATASSTYTDQLAVSRNDGAVTYVQTSGTPNLVVSPTGLVSVTSSLADGSYTARGTMSDAFGDKGTFVFTLKVAAQVIAPIPAPPVLSNVIGHASPGKTMTLSIKGSGFYGRPSVTSHHGTTALVMRDTGTMLAVRVTVAPRSRNGIFTFTVTLPNGQSSQIKYNQHP